MGRGRILVPLGWLTIHHVSFLHVPLGSSTLQTGSSWFRAHNGHLQHRAVISQCHQPPEPPDLFLDLPLYLTVVSRHPLLPASIATNLLTLPIEVHERVAGLGDIGHSHPLVHPVDMEMQSPRAVEPQSQDGAFRTRVQIWPELLTDLGGRGLLSPQRADSRQQQPPPPFTLPQVASPWASPPHLPTVWALPPASMT